MRKKILLWGIIIILSMSLISAYDSWPTSEQDAIDSGLYSGYEPSGAVWHYGLQQIILVGDDGDVTIMDKDGKNSETISPGGDLEGVTLVDRHGDFVYLIQEHPAKIIEYSLSTKQLTGKSWDIQDELGYTDTSRGAEALTYIPAGQHQFPNTLNGVFAVGLQEDGKIYFFDINLDESNDFQFLGMHTSSIFGLPIIVDISGLDYNIESKKLYAIFDVYNLMLELKLENGIWTTVENYELAGKNQEGIAIEPTSSTEKSVYIAEDTGAAYRYDSFPDIFPTFETFSDSDTLSDHEELVLGTNPYKWDTDGDSISDHQEVKQGTDPLSINDRSPEKMISYELVNEETISITYKSDRTYEVTPFNGEEIEHYWPNKWDRTLFVTNGKEVVRVRNGEVVNSFEYKAQVIESYNLLSPSSFSVKYVNGYITMINPFNGEDILFIWTNSANRVIYVFNGEVVYAYKNGVKFKEVTPRNPGNYLTKLFEKFGYWDQIPVE